MILSDREINKAIADRTIIIDPVPGEEQYTTSALDLILGDEFWEFKSEGELRSAEPAGVERPLIVNPSQVRMEEFLDRYHKRRVIEQDGTIILEPNKVLLGVTREYVRLPTESRLAARVEGRSTLARLGLMVHLTAPTIHCGFSGPIVLEMINLSTFSLRLEPGRLAICQLIFERLRTVPRGPVRTRYQGQRGVRR